MHRQQITMLKVNALRRLFIQGPFNRLQTSKKLKISRNTLKKYVDEFEAIKKHYPDKLADVDFFMPVPKQSHRCTPLYLELVKVLPTIIVSTKSISRNISEIWREYKVLYPHGYSYGAFKTIIRDWSKDKNFPKLPTTRTNIIKEEDLETVRKWKHGNHHRNWQIAIFLEATGSVEALRKVAEKIDIDYRSIQRWVQLYKSEGLEGFKLVSKTTPEKVIEMTTKGDNLIDLLHQTPKIHGINRTSWTLKDLATTYTEVYKENMCKATVSVYLKKRGYAFRRSREVLTSPDPLFREKLNIIQDILSNLGNKEKFFSIDEFGPCGVKMKGGRTLVPKGTYKTIPAVQQSKGYFVCTAALELSTNQITHFYSYRKDTLEMKRLINILIEQYKGQDTLYLSWDAASWHTSKELMGHLELLNSETYRDQYHTPFVKLAPLPSSAQFLNVIESVFSGLAKSVIHNSNYGSLNECKEAVSLYFETRNKHFIENPKQAGFKIWGKERTNSVFHKANNCRYMS